MIKNHNGVLDHKRFSHPVNVILQSGQVVRNHTTNLEYQTIGNHTWGVMVLLDHFYPDSPQYLLRAALYHDCPEFITGDSPAPVKWEYPEIKAMLDKVEQEVGFEMELPEINLTPEEKAAVKNCDILEFLHRTVCLYEQGNGLAFYIFKRAGGQLITRAPVLNTKIMIYSNHLSRRMGLSAMFPGLKERT